MKTTLTSDRPLKLGVAVKICERDSAGGLVGFWTGYWNPNKEIVRLYPAANPYCTWKVPRIAHAVSDAIIEVPRSERKNAPCGARESGRDKSNKVTIASTTSKAMRNIIGQMKIKF